MLSLNRSAEEDNAPATCEGDVKAVTNEVY